MMRSYKKKKMRQRISALAEGLVASIGGFAMGLLIIAACMFMDIIPTSLLLSRLLLWSPVILAVGSFIFVIWQDIDLFRKEW